MVDEVTFPNGNQYLFPASFFGEEGYEYVENFPALIQDIVDLQSEINADSSVINKRAALAQTASSTVIAIANQVRRIASQAKTYRDQAQAAVGGVKVSANDTTAANLDTKIVAGGGVTIAEQNDGSNESLLISTNRKYGAMLAQSFG